MAGRTGRYWLEQPAGAGMKAFTCCFPSTPRASSPVSALPPASTKDQRLAEDFFAFRHTPHPRLPHPGGTS